MSNRPTPETDATSCSDGVEMLTAQSDPFALYQKLCEATAKISQWENDFDLMKRERDEAREELAEAKREAENLAKSIYRSEYSDNDTDWELLDSVAGVISQIDNMYAGVREQRDEAIRLLKLCADHTITTYQEEAEEFLKRIK